MQDIVISFGPTGVVQGLHRDEFPLDFLGRQKVERASEIKFDDDAQSWTVWFPREGDTRDYATDPSFAGFDSYSGARSFEVEYLNRCRLEGIAPLSEEGVTLAGALRAATEGR